MQLYVPAAVSVPAAATRVKKPPALPLVVPHPSTLQAKLPPPRPTPNLPIPDLPNPPELSVTRKAPVPARQPVLPAPAAIPAPPSPVFAAALPATPPPAAKLQVSGTTFDTVPADSPRRNSQPGAMLPAGFGAAGTTAANPHRATSIAVSNGFGGVAAAPPSQEPAAKPAPAGTAFTAAVAADPRQPPAHRQPAAEPLEILYKPRPAYTEEARRAHIEGDIVLEVLFPGTGNLRVLRVVRGLGYGLEQNALDAAAKIRFRPSREDGHAVDTVAQVRISFQLAY
jgi:TonB family protein